MANLSLDDRQRQLVDVDVVHDVAVAERVDGQFVEYAAPAVTGIFAVQPNGSDISSEELPEPVFGIAALRGPPRVEEVLGRALHARASLGHAAGLPKIALQVVHEAAGKVADAPLLGCRVLGREIDRAAVECHVLELDPDELADPATQLVHRPHHQLVSVIIDRIEELLQLLYR